MIVIWEKVWLAIINWLYGDLSSFLIFFFVLHVWLITIIRIRIISTYFTVIAAAAAALVGWKPAKSQ